MNKELIKDALMNSPLAQFITTTLILLVGLIGIASVTETLLLATIFFVFMLPAWISAAVSLKEPLFRLERTFLDRIAHI